jgi:hypothetical protein
MEHMVVAMAVAQDLVVEVMVQAVAARLDIPVPVALLQMGVHMVMREHRVQVAVAVQVVQVMVEGVAVVLAYTVKVVMDQADQAAPVIMVVRVDQVVVMAVQDHKAMSLT